MTLPVNWSVGLVAVVLAGTAGLLWPRTRGIRPPRGFAVSLRWSGRGYLPRQVRRAMLQWIFGLLIVMTAVGGVADIWIHNWIVCLVFPAIVLPVIAMGIWPRSLGGTVHANPDEFFFEATGLWALSGSPVRYRWRDVAEWTVNGTCVDCLARNGSRRWRICLPAVPPEHGAQVEGWLSTAK